MSREAPGTLRAVAVPTEHGGWGFTLEPILLGLAVAPGPAGAGLAAAALAVFLARRPLRVLTADLRARRRLPRTATALWVLAACSAVIAGGLALAATTGAGPFWWALAAAVPAAAVQVAADLAHRNRDFLAEAAGAVAMGAAAPAIALAAGWDAGPAFGLWAVIAARAVPSILLVRAQIRRGRGEPGRPAACYGAHALALAAVGTLAGVSTVPRAAVGAVALLWAWAAFSLRRPPVPARTLGWTQMLTGLLVVALTALGHHLGW